MSSVLFALALYAAATVFLVGTGYKIYRYARVPVPLKIPTTPAPSTRSGVVWRMFKEVVLFESLFKADKWLWLLGWIFHASLLMVVLGHARYVVEPVWGWVAALQALAPYAGLMLGLSLAGLWARRFLIDRVRYISSPSDHLMLALLLALALTGVSMRSVARTDLVGAKAFMLGLTRLDWQPLPGDAVLQIHIALVAVLMFVFPFSKLLHAPGVFFSPTRYQIDNPRERRYAPAPE